MFEDMVNATLHFQTKPYVVSLDDFQPMVETLNHTLRILQEICGAVQALDARVAAMDSKIDRNDEKHQKRLNGLQLAMQGKGFEDHCAVARFDQRISALEKRSPRSGKPKMIPRRLTHPTVSSTPR
jgi:hypothetical protein